MSIFFKLPLIYLRFCTTGAVTLQVGTIDVCTLEQDRMDDSVRWVLLCHQLFPQHLRGQTEDFGEPTA